MRITWRDGITTLAAGGTVLLERAYFHGWEWPLISSTRWTIAGIALLMAISLSASYVFDAFRGVAWSWIAGVLGLTAATLTGLGLYFAISDYVVLLMLTTLTFWLASILRHLTVPSSHGFSHV